MSATPADSRAPQLELRGVSKYFGSFAAVDGLSLVVKKGEIFGFLGPNGAGKSTTIRMILDAARPSAGTILLFGQSNRRTASLHQRIGYLSGDMVIDEDLTGRQYLDFVGSLYRGNHKQYAHNREQLIRELELDVDQKISKYSRGNKQKVGLVAALMHAPRLLVLDEPSSGLDPLMQEVFIRLIEAYRRAGGTVFMSSHSMAEVQRLCDQVAFIREGKLAGIVGTGELSKSALKYINAAGDVEEITHLARRIDRLPGVSESKLEGGRLHFKYSGPAQRLLEILAVYSLADLTIREPELEEIFMSYYQSSDKPANGATT